LLVENSGEVLLDSFRHEGTEDKHFEGLVNDFELFSFRKLIFADAQGLVNAVQG